MATITLQGNKISTNGDLPKVGSKAPDFKLTKTDMSDVSLADFKGKKKILDIVVSLDTGICVNSMKKFNEVAMKRNDVAVLVISADLPFAMARVCGVENTKNVTTLSMMRNKNFAKDYGILIQDGSFAGITARSVVVLDADDKVLYTELVPEIASDPNFDKALKALG